MSTVAKSLPAPLRISDVADLIQASSPETPIDNEPDLIVLCAYMDGKLRHLRAFIQPYQHILPRTPILVVYANMSIYFRMTASCQADLVPVARYLEQSKPSRIHAHVLSNGGAFQLVILGQVLRDRMATAILSPQTFCPDDIANNVLDWTRSHPFPLSSITFDSTPGSNSIGEALASFGAGMKSSSQPRVIHWAIDLQCTIFALLVHSVDLLPGFKVYQTLLRQWLLDTSAVNNKAKRLYIYSKEDKLVRWQALESHIEQARHAELDIKSELFNDSQHVQHVRKDPQRYWEAVRALLKSVERNRGKL